MIRSIKLHWLRSLTVFILLNALIIACKNDDQTPSLHISGFSPESGGTGATVTINGSAFSTTASNNSVKFNGTEATVTSSTTSSITTTVPAGATTGKITVTVNGVTATSGSNFTVNNAITSIEPSYGVAGGSVTITGTGFDATAENNSVKFNGAEASITSASATQLIVTVPEAATTGNITVTTNGSLATSSSSFSILTPLITDFSPVIGAAGISVVIHGIAFSTTSDFDVVKFNGIPAVVTFASEIQITATVPANVTTGKITVTIGPNTATSTDDFTACSGAAELIISNLTITDISGDRTSFNYAYDLTNVGDMPADLSKMSDQGYVSTDNADNGGDLAASGWTVGSTTLNAGEAIHVQFSSNIVGGGTVDNHPYLVLKVFGTVTECNTDNDTVVKSIL
jgi:hypothetical protein